MLAWNLHEWELSRDRLAFPAQEILTDPSYKGQIVAFTHVHIGNTGINFGACSLIAPLRGPMIPSLTS